MLSADWSIVHNALFSLVRCLVDKPWDWDMAPLVRDAAAPSDMQRILSGVGLDVVQTVRSLGVFDH